MKSVACSVAGTARAIRTPLHRDRGAVSGSRFIYLRLACIQQHQQPCIVSLSRVIDYRVLQVRRRHRGAVGEVRGISLVDRHRVCAILQGAIAKDQVHARNGTVTKSEIPLGVGAESIKIKRRIRRISSAIKEDNYQPIERCISRPTIEQLNKLSGVSASLVAVHLVDDHAERRRWCWGGTRRWRRTGAWTWTWRRTGTRRW